MARRSRTPATNTLLETMLILLGLGLLLGALVAGFVLGRASAPEGDGGAAAAATEATTTVATVTGLTTVTGDTATTDTGATTQTETGAGPGDDTDGAAVFESAGCGGCHTLSAANSSGTVGPNLDNVDLSKSEIENAVRTGPGAMPSFAGRLSDEEIEAVADYVEGG